MSITELNAAIEEFRNLQDQYGDYGACDSEPDEAFERAITNALKGVDKVPTTAEGWQLFTITKNCDSAARALTAQCKKVVALILNTPISQKDAAIECLKKYCPYL